MRRYRRCLARPMRPVAVEISLKDDAEIFVRPLGDVESGENHAHAHEGVRPFVVRARFASAIRLSLIRSTFPVAVMGISSRITNSSGAL